MTDHRKQAEEHLARVDRFIAGANVYQHISERDVAAAVSALAHAILAGIEGRNVIRQSLDQGVGPTEAK